MEIFVIISIISILVTCLLNLFFKKKRYVKYIPVIIMFPIMIYYFITTYSAPSEGFQALGRFVMGLMLLTAILSSTICSIVIDVYHNKKVK